MIAYKLLGEGGVAPFTGFRWPQPSNNSPGAWVEADAVEPCRNGVHACRPRDLPFWVAQDLWEIELAGDVVVQERKLVAPRGRLVRRITSWGPSLLAAYADGCLARTRERVGSIPTLSGFVADVGRLGREGRIALAAFAAARAAERFAGPRGYEQERELQARWLAARLGLGGVDW